MIYKLKRIIIVPALISGLLYMIFCSTNPAISEDKNDYLPLNVSNSWTYSFSRNSRDDIDQNSTISKGSATIKLISIIEVDNQIKYFLNIQKEGQRIYRDLNITTGEQVIDTSYIAVNDTLVFIEDSSGTVRNETYQHFFSFTLPRYTSEESDTLVFYNAYTTFEMLKNVGIISYGYDSYHNWSGSWGKWTLNSYELY